MVLKCVSEERGMDGERRVDNKNTLVRVLCCSDSRGKRKTRQCGQTKSKPHQEMDWGQEST